MCRIWESLIYNIFELKRRVLGEKEHPAPYYMTLLLYNKSLDKVVSKVTVWKNYEFTLTRKYYKMRVNFLFFHTVTLLTTLSRLLL